MYGKWDPVLMTELLGHMTPQQARLDVQSRDYDAVSKQIQQASLCPTAAAAATAAPPPPLPPPTHTHTRTHTHSRQHSPTPLQCSRNQHQPRHMLLMFDRVCLLGPYLMRRAIFCSFGS